VTGDVLTAELVETGEILEVKSSEDDLIPRPPEGDYREWPEYREHVRKVRCVVCQYTRGKDFEGNQVEEVDYTPELVRVSDPHHVKTWGSGGPDAENLVPLCRFHHSELGNMGTIEFQLKYNYDLRSAARVIFQHFLQTFKETEYAERFQAEHQLALSRLHDMKMNTLQLGDYLRRVHSKSAMGQQGYKMLGFPTFEAYLAAPVASGGLGGINRRTAYRMVTFSKAHELYSTEKVSILELGPSKTSEVWTMLQKADDDDEREEIISHAIHMSKNDLVGWIGQKKGKPDPRKEAHQRMVDFLQVLFDSVGGQSPDEITMEKMAWEVIDVAKGRKVEQAA
jgi:hypothetical protein